MTARRPMDFCLDLRPDSESWGRDLQSGSVKTRLKAFFSKNCMRPWICRLSRPPWAKSPRKTVSCESKVAYKFSKKYGRKHSRATPGAAPEPVNFRGVPRTPGHRPTKFNFFVGVYWAFQYTYRDTIQKKLSRRVFLVSAFVYDFLSPEPRLTKTTISQCSRVKSGGGARNASKTNENQHRKFDLYML